MLFSFATPKIIAFFPAKSPINYVLLAGSSSLSAGSNVGIVIKFCDFSKKYGSPRPPIVVRLYHAGEVWNISGGNRAAGRTGRRGRRAERALPSPEKHDEEPLGCRLPPRSRAARFRTRPQLRPAAALPLPVPGY